MRHVFRISLLTVLVGILASAAQLCQAADEYSYDPVHSSIGLIVVALGVPVSGWVLSQRPTAAKTITSRSALDTAAPASASADPPSVTTIGTNS